MGLCPDCESKGKTATYVGSSKEEILSKFEDRFRRDNQEHPSSQAEGSGDVLICDLCESEYEPRPN